ncbi:ferredoxin [Planotetraspora silvatica]|uniref:Ferredoxin n=1 Tax=Planotetraspora silvatica TaxID=234614 RepID=A0A8J3UE84_9ACTN|nr:ferredoxin [Planotetraspora silvatica]GII43598.1 ferredoxin [Planotetraspora silvatica]
MKVEVEPDKCIASGQCVLIAGSVFDQNEDDGIVVLLGSEVTGGEEDAVLSAARVCPARAIHVLDGQR